VSAAEAPPRERVAALVAPPERLRYPEPERFASAFHSAPIGMALVDAHDGWIEVNEALCHMTGRSSEELRAGALWPIVKPSRISSERKQQRQLLTGEISSYEVERRFQHAAGHDVSALLTASLARDADGAPRFTIFHVQDISERKALEARHSHLLDHDFLTGLFSRRRFTHELAQQVARVARYGPRGALLLLDLDHFKEVNDHFGHEAGDELLTRIASGLRRRVRRTDVLARFGGDEFALLLPRADLEEAQTLAHALLLAVRTYVVPSGTGVIRMTASIGIALVNRLSEAELLACADRAMYQAKGAGGDRVAIEVARR
jgi:diguanylate cyclase (GGDEF)-like protein/PAS domain S-box-containing protein